MGAFANIYEALTGAVNFELDFGGNVNAADNSAALMAFNAEAREQSALGRKVVLMVPPGLYQFNHKNCQGYLLGIKHLHIKGYGAIFQNTYNLAEGQSFANEIAWGAAASSNALGSAGIAINTTVIGDTSVTCTTASQAGGFTVGEWIMVSCADIQTLGYPPNMDRFEFTKVTSVDAGTGVVGVSPPIRHIHRSDYIDGHQYGGAYGKARINRLDNTDGTAPWDVEHIYEGLEIRNAPTVDTYYFSITGRRVKFLNCTIPGISPTVASQVEIVGCTVTDVNEPDKLVEGIYIERSRFTKAFTLPSSSLNSVSLRDVIFDDSCALGSSKYTYAENCQFKTVSLGGQFGLNRKVTLMNCHAHAASAPGFDTGFGGSVLAINGTNVAYANGAFTVLKSFGSQHNWNVIPGQQIALCGPNNMFPGDMGVGFVTTVTDNETHRIITTTLPHTSLPAWCSSNAIIQRVGELHCINCSGADVMRNASEAERVGVPPFGYKRFIIGGTPSTGGNWANAVYGTWTRARVNVIKVSPAANSKLNLFDSAARLSADLTDPLQLKVIIDMTVAGVRDFSASGLTGKTGADDLQLNSVTQGSWLGNRILGGTFQWSFTNLTPSSFSDYQLPIIEVELWFDTGLWRKPLPAYKDASGGTIFGATGGL